MCKLTTCCGCIPLRTGLLILGYLHLISRVSLLIQAGRSSTDNQYVTHDYAENVLAKQKTSTIVGLIIDAIFTVVLIVAAHKRNAKLMKVYYVYSIIQCIFVSIICVLLLYYSWDNSEKDSDLFLNFVVVIIIMLLSVYSVSLFKSAVEKFQGPIGSHKVYHQPQLHGVVVNQTPCSTIQQPQSMNPGYQSPPSYSTSPVQSIPVKY